LISAQWASCRERRVSSRVASKNVVPRGKEEKRKFATERETSDHGRGKKKKFMSKQKPECER